MTTTRLQLDGECRRQLGVPITAFHNFNIESYRSLAEARTALLKQYRNGQYVVPISTVRPTYTLEHEDGTQITGNVDHLRHKLGYKSVASITKLINGTVEVARGRRLVS